MTVYTQNDSGRQVSAAVGETFELRLPENATTGYRWVAAAFAQDVVAPVGASADYPAAAIGSGGAAIFRFRALAPGRAELALRYKRAWERDDAATGEFRLEVTVKP